MRPCGRDPVHRQRKDALERVGDSTTTELPKSVVAKYFRHAGRVGGAVVGEDVGGAVGGKVVGDVVGKRHDDASPREREARHCASSSEHEARATQLLRNVKMDMLVHMFAALLVLTCCH